MRESGKQESRKDGCRVKSPYVFRPDRSAWVYLKSVAMDLGKVAAVWFAVNGNVPCGNLTLFLAGMALVFSPLFLVWVSEPPPGRFSEWQSDVKHVLMVSLCVAYGWLWCAAAFFWSWLWTFAVFTIRNKRAAQKQETGSAGGAA